MRSLVYLFMLASLACGNTAACLAQQPGPATLEGLVNSGEAQEAPTAAEADAGPNRPAGTVTRPKDGVKHPDLDKAWIDYDVAVGKAAESIKAAINKQFDAATAKGDLDAAEKWQNALEKFEKAGVVPMEKETETAVSDAIADFTKAKEELTKVYEAMVKALTMEKRIDEAKAVRGELAGFNSQKPAVAAQVENESNLALRKPTQQSSVYKATGAKHDSDLGVDGEKGPFPQPQGLVMTDLDKKPWWQVDLKGVHILTEVKLFNRIDCCQERLNAVEVFLSNDGKKWRSAYSHDGKPIGDTLAVNVKGQSARFVRVVLNKKEQLHFYECEVYGH